MTNPVWVVSISVRYFSSLFLKRFFRPLALGDVVECDNEIVWQESGVEFANAYRTIAAGNPVFAGVDSLAGFTGYFQKRFPSVNHLAPVIGIRVRDLIPLRCGGRSMSEKGEGAATPEINVVILNIDHGNGERCSIENGAELCLALPQGFLRLLALGDVMTKNRN